MSKRRDKCKCGKILVWDPEKDNEVKCLVCNTSYTVEADSVLIYWLEEKIDSPRPYRTYGK